MVRHVAVMVDWTILSKVEAVQLSRTFAHEEQAPTPFLLSYSGPHPPRSPLTATWGC